MKGTFKITIETRDDGGAFPITETVTLGVDNTPEGIVEMVSYFRKILLMMGFAVETVNEYVPDAEIDPE